ncbi:ABC transporter substrate-binding protein [Paenibacillus yanchengensis]|uniref:ABC transporter substrate-binding protein n=1 Tax=Paenibacillus yanchengensis TaxID=2035833 RepID=A0ABW4YKE2_9BACL
MRNKSRVFKLTRQMTVVSLVLIFSISLLSACSKASPKDNQNSVIRIGMLYGDGVDNHPHFRQQYTDAYELLNNGKVTFEIVSALNDPNQRFDYLDPNKQNERLDLYEQMKQLVTGENPVDVVVMDYEMLPKMYQDNLLQSLDPLIQRDKFDTSAIVPAVIEGIKAVGDNSLYALTPTFSSSALFYNKKFFSDLQIEPPTDNMTWEEVFNLARRITKVDSEDPRFGFAFDMWANGDSARNMSEYVSALQLAYFDETADNMLVNSDRWVNAWELIVNMNKENVFPTREYTDQLFNSEQNNENTNPFLGDLFLSGKLGMVIGQYYYVNELRLAADNASRVDGFEMIDWDVVTLPTDAANPGASSGVYLQQLMGINAKAQNPDGAWDFIKFINGEDWAKIKSRSIHDLVARKDYIKPVGEMQYNIDAFLNIRPLTPRSENIDQLYETKPGIWEARNFGYELFERVAKDEMTVREALAEWETKGNQALQATAEEIEVPDMTTKEALKEAAGIE